MAKRKSRKIAPVAITEALVMPTPEQVRRGYSGRYVMDEKGLMAWAYQNSNHDPVTRWENVGKLEPRHIAVIDTVRRLWRLSCSEPCVIANYGERIGRGSSEGRAINEIEATKDLTRIKGYIPRRYWDVFENVVRNGWAAGVAGAELGYKGNADQDRAHIIVVFVCDIIGNEERI